MGLADFDQIDVVAREPDGGERWIMVAGLGFPEAEEALFITLFLIKLAAYERHGAHQERRPQVELVSTDEPPQCVVEILRRRGHTATVGVEARAPARGRPSKLEVERDGFLDIDALQEKNAAAFAHTYRLPLPPDFNALGGLDAVLVQRRAEHQGEPEDLADGKLMVLAGAYAGEVIRIEAGGGWCYESEATVVESIYLVTATGYKVNALGKVAKFLQTGPGESVAMLVAFVRQMVRG